MLQPFSKRERKAICVVVLLLVLFIGGGFYLMPHLVTTKEIVLSEAALSELKHFDRVTSAMQSASSTNAPALLHLKNFDPNTIDSTEFMALGFPLWLTNNILKYRKAGGRWRKAEDFRKLYGMSDELFAQIKPYIKITPTVSEQKRDSIHKLQQPKFEHITTLDLNTVDTLTLQRIPGIGKHYARSIVALRLRLGGFIDVAQLSIIDGLPTDITKWFEVSPDFKPQKQGLNEASFKTLARHPYLTYEQVKTLKSHIRKYGRFKDWGELLMYSNFTEKDIKRLQIYFELGMPQPQVDSTAAKP